MLRHSLYQVLLVLISVLPHANGEWIKANPENSFSSEVRDIAAGEGAWIAVGERGLIAFLSDDRWHELLPFSQFDLNSVLHTGEHFLVVGDSGLILSSEEGDITKWSIVESGTSVDLFDVKKLDERWFINGENGLLLESQDTVNWRIINESERNDKDFECITFFNGEFIALEDRALWRSNDGINWVEDSNEPYVSYPVGIAVLNGQVVAWGSGNEIAFSSDGHTWTPGGSLPMRSVTDIIFEAGYYFLVGYDGDPDEDLPIYYSTDLLNWHETDGRGRHGIESDGVFFMVPSGHQVETSFDGLQWIGNSEFLLEPKVFRHGKFFGLYRNYLYSSIDGENWTSKKIDLDFTGKGIYEAGGTYFTMNGNKIAISEDLENWESKETPEYWNGGKFIYAFGNFYSNRSPVRTSIIHKSTDGLNWTRFRSGYSIAYGNNRLVTVQYDADDFVTAVSTDGVRDTLYATPNQPSASSITFGKGLFVATRGGDTYRIRTSPDGINWTNRDLPSTVDGGFEDVVFTGGRFIASGFSSTVVSTDGISWFDVSYGAATGESHSAVFGNDRWLLGARAPLIMDESLETVLIGDISNHEFTRVYYLDGSFWALSETTFLTGSLWRSLDGQDWVPVKTFSFEPRSLAIIGSRVLVADRFYGEIAVSDNLSDWTVVDRGSFVFQRDLLTFQNIVFSSQKNGLFRSTDGLTWDRVSAVPGSDIVSIISSPEGITLIAASDHVANIFHSTDGISWTNTLSSSAHSGDRLVGLIFLNSKIIASRENGDIFESTDGVNWTLLEGASNIPVRNATISDQYLYSILGGRDGNVYRSNLSNPYEFNRVNSVGWINSMAHGPNISVAVGPDDGLYYQTQAEADAMVEGSSIAEIRSHWLELTVDSLVPHPAGFRVRYRKVGASDWTHRFFSHAEEEAIVFDGLLPYTAYEVEMAVVYPGRPAVFSSLSDEAILTLSKREDWRLSHFGTAENLGEFADEADFDKDGIDNLVEYAFKLDPKSPDLEADFLTYSASTSGTSEGVVTFKIQFWCDAEIDDLTFSIWKSSDLDFWQFVGQSVNGWYFSGSNVYDPYAEFGESHSFREVEAEVTTDSDSFFMRLEIESNKP